jgi:sugar phosphate isomerase/epimerase
VETFAERIDEVLADARELGFDAVDLWGAHLHPSWATDEHVAAARAALDRHGLRAVALASGLGPEDVERACELAVALDARLVGGGYSGDLREAAPLLRRHGVRYGLENHPERTPAEVLERIAGAEDVFGVTVDTGWWATQGYDPVRALEELGERVLHVHLKDVPHEGEPHETCPWGEGVVPIEECVRTLVGSGYAGALTIEHEPERGDPREAVRELRERLERWLA